MPSTKTALTPEEQWRRTIHYVRSFRRQPLQEDGAVGQVLLWVVRTPHRLLSLGDVLIVTATNGMVERYAMSGVSSKGVRLKHFYVPLRRNMGDWEERTAELPGDLIDLRWDDPAIGRFVADLRASSRRRVGASIPAPIPSIPTALNTVPPVSGLRFDGVYRSRRDAKHKRSRFFDRSYLRFFADGKVISTPGFGIGWPRGITPDICTTGPWGSAGTFQLNDDQLAFAIRMNGEIVEQYAGRIDGANLRLSKHCRSGWGRDCDEVVYKFHPWVE